MGTVQVAVTEGFEVQDAAVGDHQGVARYETITVTETAQIAKGGTYESANFNAPASFVVLNPFNYVELYTEDD